MGVLKDWSSSFIHLVDVLKDLKDLKDLLVASFWGCSVRAAEACSTQGGPCPLVSQFP